MLELLTINFKVVIFWADDRGDDVEFISITNDDYAKIQQELTSYLDVIATLGKANQRKIRKVSANSFPLVYRLE